MKINSKQEIEEYFLKLRLNKEPNKRENWGIFVNGERIRLSNGKSVWNKKNHASSAMRNEIDRWIKPNWYSDYKSANLRYNSPEYNTARDEYNKLSKKVDEYYEELKDSGVIQFLPV